MSVDYYNRKDVGILPRLMVGTGDGSFHCLKDSSILWTLEESLTETTCSLIVDLDKPASEGKYWYNVKKESLHNLSLFSQFLIRIQRHAFLLTVIADSQLLTLSHIFLFFLRIFQKRMSMDFENWQSLLRKEASL